MISVIRIISVLLLLTYSKAETSRLYRFDYTYSQQVDGWLKLHRIPATWNEARLRCHAEGAVLASPLTTSFLRTMVDIVKSNQTFYGIFTGIHSTLYKGVYRSIEGVPLSKIPVHWATDEPNNYENNEECLLLLPDGTMADIKCNNTYPYICYKKKTKNVLTTACGTIDEKYNLEPRTGSCYKFHEICQTWRRAYMTCESEGGHLAIINSNTEAIVLKELFAKHPSEQIHCKYKDIAILGFLQWSRDGYWTTIHSETLAEAGYSSWSNGQPDNFVVNQIPQNCGAMFRTGLLDDIQCEVLLYPFICEKNPDSLLEDTRANRNRCGTALTGLNFMLRARSTDHYSVSVPPALHHQGT
ncbi:C-type mannose receptor 2-like [Aphomia sociella]